VVRILKLGTKNSFAQRLQCSIVGRESLYRNPWRPWRSRVKDPKRY